MRLKLLRLVIQLPHSMVTAGIKGIVLNCDTKGIITNVIYNELLKNSSALKGKHFPAILHPSSIEAGFSFIDEINKKLFSFDYYLTIQNAGRKHRLYFIGLKVGDELLIIGSENHQEAFSLVEEMQKINNEQANLIRKLMKDKHTTPPPDDKEVQSLFNELTRINNELVNLQRELNRKNAELERLNELKNSLIGMAAHDLRNPLGVIQNYAEFLSEQTSNKLTENQRWLLEVIQQSAHFMLGLVEDLLDYNRIESGKLELTKTTINLNTTIERWVTIQTDLAKQKQIAIKYHSNNEDITINADLRKLEQVFNNLLSNAIKFSFPGSEINVRVARKGEFATISVSDQGIGMTQEQLEMLFKPFARIAAEGTAGEKCTGLGLSIVKKIVEGHGGRIDVSSTPNKGTEFVVYLPLIKDKC